MPKPRHTRRREVRPPDGTMGAVYSSLLNSDGSPNTKESLVARTDPSLSPSGFIGSQITDSEGHHWPNSVSAGDVGGDFTTTKSYVAFPTGFPQGNKTMRTTRSDGKFILDRFQGGYHPLVGPSAIGQTRYFPADKSSSNDDLNKLGATAIANCAPGDPPADAATFTLELLREGLPSLVGASLWKDRTKSALGKTSDEYLNIQFGLLPVIREIKKFHEAVRKADEYLDQLERDAGRVVRRSYRFPQRAESRELFSRSDVPLQGFGISARPLDRFRGTLRCVETVQRDTWFSGAFTYYIPSDYDSRNKIRAYARDAEFLLGTEVTPEVIWNVAPWSWAIDWFTNTGDVVKNISRFGNKSLVMRYGYVMEHTITKHTWTWNQTNTVPGEGQISYPPIVFITETKKRRAANPFGFGVTWDGLSSFQASILTALGISRRSR